MDHLHRFVFEHRRLLAAVCTALAVVAGLGTIKQSPEGSRILVASRDLPSGRVISAADVRPATLPRDAVPSHAFTLDATVVGRRVAGPMRRGEALTDYRVLKAGVLAGYGSTAVLTTVRVAEADGLTGVRVGDRVNVIAVDPDGEITAKVIARGVEVVTVPAAAEGTDVIALGIVTTEKVALLLASAALEARFSVVSSAS